MGVARDNCALTARKEATRMRYAIFPLALVLCAALAGCGIDEIGSNTADSPVQMPTPSWRSRLFSHYIWGWPRAIEN
jgi:hypothetical protein